MLCCRTVFRIFRLRNLFLLLAACAFALGGLLLSYRWWVPSVLPIALDAFGVEVDSVEWKSEDKVFRIESVAYAAEGVTIDLDWVELPDVWVYLKERGQLNGGSLVVELEPVPSEAASEGGDYGPVDLRNDLDAPLALLDDWLPKTQLAHFSVGEKDGVIWLTGRDLSYAERRLEVALQVMDRTEWVDVEAELKKTGPWRLELAVEELAIGLVATIGAVESETVPIVVDIVSGDDQLSGRANFAGTAWLPQSASLHSQDFVVDPNWLPEAAADNFESLVLNTIAIDWEDAAFSGAVSFAGVYATSEAQKESFSAKVQLRGDLERLEIASLSVEARWLDLSLSAPVVLDWASGTFLGDAKLELAIQLDQQSYVDASGDLTAEVEVKGASLSGEPRQLSFEISGKELRYIDFELASVSAEGAWSGDLVTVERLSVVPEVSEKGVQISGTYGIEQRVLDFEYVADLSAEWLNVLSSTEYFVEALHAKGTLQGDVSEPKLGANLRAVVQHPSTEVIALEGELQTVGMKQVGWIGSAKAEGAEINLNVRTEIMSDAVKVDLRELVWSDSERPDLVLKAPVQINWSIVDDVALNWERRLRIGPFELVGEDLLVRGNYLPAGESERGELAGLNFWASNVSMKRLNRWLVNDLPEYAIEEVAVQLNVFRPYILGALKVELEEAVPESAELMRLNLEAALTESSLVVNTLKLDFSGVELLHGQVALPLRLGPNIGADGQFWELLSAGRLEGLVSGALTPEFSAWLERKYGVRVAKGQLRLDTKGTLAKPEGGLELIIEGVSVDPSVFGRALPETERVQLLATATKERIELKPFSVRVRDASIEGEISLPTAAFTEWIESEDLDALKLFEVASGRVTLSDWAMEDWMEWAPDIMRRTGSVEGSLVFSPGSALEGDLKLKDFALRPTATLPSINQIGGSLKLVDKRLELSETSASIGGHPVRFHGVIDANNWTKPSWQLDIEGENVPLVRTREMILRSDLKLTARTREGELQPVVEGALNLRSSTLLVEVDPLSPKYEGGVVKRPPYFSISEAPFADWQFDLTIKGEEFLRVRSPYFKALLSANFMLTGSFEYPELIGGMRTNDTEVRFPGATMRLDEGEAFISASQPDALQLNFKGVAQKTGYVVSMEVSETLSEPQITFQSTPELTNAEIIRLLATGSLNGGGLGSAGLYIGQGLMGSGGFKESWAERLSVDVGSELSREGRNTIDVRYDLSDDWYLNGEYDRFDAYNLDLGWRLYEK